MRKTVKALVMTAAVAATTIVPLAGAHADDWRYRHYRYDRHHGNGNAVAAGVLGLAAGAIIGGAIAESRAEAAPRYYEVEPAPRYYYRPAPRVYYPPAPAYQRPYPVAVGGIEPWTRPWYNYCSDRYRSFNPTTGTFRGYDGQEHFCVAN